MIAAVAPVVAIEAPAVPVVVAAAADVPVRLAAAALAGVVVALVLARLRSPGHAARRAGRSGAYDRAAGRPGAPTPTDPASLDRLDRAVRTAPLHGGMAPGEVRAVLHDIAAELLRQRHGVDLDTEPGAARALLGPEVHDLVRADRHGGEGPGSGPSTAQVERALQALEAL